MVGLKKTFGRNTALDGFNLSVSNGDVHGFLGPNGAGKSTALRVMLGLLRADAGHTNVLGFDPWRDAPQLHSRIAYVPGDVTLWPSLSGGETIDLLGRMHGRVNTVRRDELIARFQLDPGKKARSYSKGNRQKVALIAALAADAELLLLDEPTSGLDPIMEAEFRRYLANDRPDGQTVLLSSHILSEVEAACDRVTIINRGQTVESGSLQQLRHLSATRVRVEFLTGVPQLPDLPGVSHVDVDGNVLTCTVEPSHFDNLLACISGAGINTLTCAPPSLEELFLQHYQQRSPQINTVVGETPR